MSAQTSYTRNLRKALAGMIFDLSDRVLSSRSCENGPCAFGIGVTRGTDADNQAEPAVDETGFKGITVRALDMEGAANTGLIQYEDTESMAIMEKGKIWVAVPSGCVPGDLGHYTNGTGVIDAGAATVGQTQMDGYFDTTAAAGEVAVFVLNSTDTTAGA